MIDLSLVNILFFFIIVTAISIDLGLKLSKIYKTNLDFDPKYKSIQKIKRIDLLNINANITIAFILYIFNTMLQYENLIADLKNPIKLFSSLICLLLIALEFIIKFTFNYYTHIFVYEDGILIENTLVLWDKCIVTKEEPSFITNGSVQISYESVENKKLITKLIKVPRNTDLSFMQNVTLTNHKCL